MEDLFKLPLHDSTKTVLKKMGIVFVEGDDSYNVRGFNAELNKWGNYEIAMETTMEFDIDDEEIADFYYVIKFNEKEVCRLQATPQLLAVFQLFAIDRVSDGKMAESLLQFGDDDFGLDLP